MLRAEGLSTLKGPQIYLLDPPSRGQCHQAMESLSTRKTLGSRVWLGAHLGSPGQVECPLDPVLDDSLHIWPYSQHTLETEKEERQWQSFVEEGKRDQNTNGEREREMERRNDGLNSGCQAMLNYRRDRKQ